VAKWLRHRIANPTSPVRIRAAPCLLRQAKLGRLPRGAPAFMVCCLRGIRPRFGWLGTPGEALRCFLGHTDLRGSLEHTNLNGPAQGGFQVSRVGPNRCFACSFISQLGLEGGDSSGCHVRQLLRIANSLDNPQDRTDSLFRTISQSRNIVRFIPFSKISPGNLPGSCHLPSGQIGLNSGSYALGLPSPSCLGASSPLATSRGISTKSHSLASSRVSGVFVLVD
jgi:hypothetical protein